MYSEYRKLKDMDFVALDIETTGLNPKNSSILEIGVIHFSRDKIIHTSSSFIRPVEFQNNAFHINGITSEMIKNASSTEKIFEELFPVLHSKPLIIQNAEFDLSFLLNDTHLSGLFENNSPVYCTLQLARKQFPGLISYSLEYLRKNFQIQKYRKNRGANIHEALDDCYAAMKVFLECANKGNLWEEDFLQTVYHQKNLKTIYDYRRKLT